MKELIMNPRGGSELTYNNLIKYLGQDWSLNNSETNLVLSFCNPNLLHRDKINVVWQQLMPDQAAVQTMMDSSFRDSVDQFVYVSNYQLNEFHNAFDLSFCNNRVIQNAIVPIEFKKKPTDKIRLIYTSTPYRGLDVLLDAFDMIDNSNLELVVYSSNIIYGSKYAQTVGKTYDQLFHRCQMHPRIVYKGYGMNQAVIKSLQESHIFAYPSTFKETSCMAALEAGAAGCKIVTTDYGVMSATCGTFANYVKYQDDRKLLAESYAEELEKTIKNYWEDADTLELQSKWFNDNHSWENKKYEWIELFEELCAK